LVKAFFWVHGNAQYQSGWWRPPSQQSLPSRLVVLCFERRALCACTRRGPSPHPRHWSAETNQTSLHSPDRGLWVQRVVQLRNGSGSVLAAPLAATVTVAVQVWGVQRGRGGAETASPPPRCTSATGDWTVWVQQTACSLLFRCLRRASHPRAGGWEGGAAMLAFPPHLTHAHARTCNPRHPSGMLAKRPLALTPPRGPHSAVSQQRKEKTSCAPPCPMKT
jgi:hypothetical protein